MSTARISGHFLFVAMMAPLLAGSACEKKANKTDPGAVKAMDRVEEASGPVDTTPLPGFDLGKLDADKQKLFYKLLGSLKSPCGKPESLRKSVTADTTCKRASFAVRYVLAILEDEGGEELAKKEYEAKYTSPAKPVKLDVSKAFRVGNNDASVRLVEFFDYTCSHCREFKPVFDSVIEAQGTNVVAYFMHYPFLKDYSKVGAQAAVAAQAQGKFKEMHVKLFERPPMTKAQAAAMAAEIGLDPVRFAADFDTAADQVDSDKAQLDATGCPDPEFPGEKRCSTPTLFFNDRKYEGPLTAKYITMWIDEEIAVNR